MAREESQRGLRGDGSPDDSAAGGVAVIVWPKALVQGSLRRAGHSLYKASDPVSCIATGRGRGRDLIPMQQRAT